MKTITDRNKSTFNQTGKNFQNRGLTQNLIAKASLKEPLRLISEMDLNSRSCLYLSAANQTSNNTSSDLTVKIGMGNLKNYRSAFFENDLNLEGYHLKLREALKV